MNIQEIIKTIKTNESIGLSEKDITDFEKEINDFMATVEWGG